MDKITIEVKDLYSVSDGYHTIAELYDHRCLLFVNLCLMDALNCNWKPDFEGWFCLFWESPSGQISYHIPDRYLPLIKDKILGVSNYQWDGHKSNDVLERLEKNAGLLLTPSPQRED